MTHYMSLQKKLESDKSAITLPGSPSAEENIK